MFQKPTYFLMHEATRRIIVCGEDEHEAEILRAKLGLTLTASVYCGLTQYRLETMEDWTRHSAFTLIAELEK